MSRPNGAETSSSGAARHVCVYIYFYIYMYRTCLCKFYLLFFLNLAFSPSPKNDRSNMDIATHHLHLKASNHLQALPKPLMKQKRAFRSSLLQSQRMQHHQAPPGHTPCQGKWAAPCLGRPLLQSVLRQVFMKLYAELLYSS